MLGKSPPMEKLAMLKYLESGFHVLSPGDYVLCAVTKARIPLDDLKYWSAEYQEAYISAEQGFKRLTEIG